jgi:DNA-binding response OmpR family regulator
MTEDLINAVDKKNIVLVADDDFYIRNIVKLALQDFAEVIEAETGEEVLALYKKHNPDVVLLDLHLPKKSGKDVLKEVLAHHAAAYVVMLSADCVVGNVKETSTDGAKSFIAKPFSKNTLLRHISACSTIQSEKKSAVG